MNINKNITNTNRTVMNNKKNGYIVIHYVGAVSSAYNNTVYFKSAYRGASATYFVDDNSIWQCVEEKDSAWHCGASLYYNGARNSNSIGIEMCCFNNKGKLDISEKTINNTIELVKDIMKRYSIPVENVVRHYDVTRKVCPAPFVEDVSRWNDFKNKLTDKPEEEIDTNDDKIAEDGFWGKDTTIKAQKVFGTVVDGIVSNQYKIYQEKNPGLLSSTFEWETTPSKNGSVLIKAIQKKIGVNQDGFIGPNTIKAMQRWLGTPQDGCVSYPSSMVKAFQKWLNEQ